MALKLYSLALILLYTLKSVNAVSIDDFGATPSDDSHETAFANAKAIQDAFQAIQNYNTEDKIVTIPSGNTYHFFPVLLENQSKFTFQIEGNLLSPKDASDVWPKADNKFNSVFTITNCTDFIITGNGKIDGQGYQWWWDTLTTKVGDDRPHLIYIRSCQDFLIENIRLKNSPFYHIPMRDVKNVVIRGIDIKVDVTAQQDLINKFEQMQTYYSWIYQLINGLIPVPMFPFNTDGIDPWGSNIHIYNVTIENYDDVVAVKPCNQGYQISKCSENILVENSRVKFGVGMTIGSVPPNDNFACVRNVTFRNIQFDKPFKAIYIKTNPGNHGNGIIEKITYENIAIYEPIWWGIYIGPQQQKQPDGAGSGCMTYPLNKDCPTQPRVPINDITLKNVTSTKGWLSPGILRCNETAPCTGWVFEDVNIQGWASSWGWYCENIFGTAKNVYPEPCFQDPSDISSRNDKKKSKKLFG